VGQKKKKKKKLWKNNRGDPGLTMEHGVVAHLLHPHGIKMFSTTEVGVSNKNYEGIGLHLMKEKKS